jgi:hypothetical protein
MRRFERDGCVAYQDRRWGWSLLFFLIIPAWLILVQEGLRLKDREVAAVAGCGTLGSAIAALALLRTYAFIIDRGAGTVVRSRCRLFWRARTSFALSRVRSVRVRTRVVEHSAPPGGRGPDWIENIHRILLEVDTTEVPFHDGISGAVGRRLASRLAEDLGVRVR